MIPSRASINSYSQKNPWLSNPERKPNSFKRLLLLIVLLSILIVASIFVVQSVFKGVLPHNQYHLTSQFTETELVGVVEQMKKDSEFNFYFLALDEEKISQATREAFIIFDHNRSPRELWQEIDLQKKRVINWAIMFRYLDVSSESLDWMTQYPQLASIMWKLLYEEFKMTILGVCYKANFDQTFQFEWPLEVIEAGNKLHAIVIKLKQTPS